MQTLRCPCPRLSWYFRIARRPAYSPSAPLVGCNEHASKPVILGLARWCEKVNIGDLWPTARSQRRYGVQFHRTRAQRYHRYIQAEVLTL